MTLVTAIIFGLLLAFIVIYITLNMDRFKPKKRHGHQDLADSLHARIAKANGAAIEQFSLKKTADHPEKDFYKNAEFVNKHCTNLDDFIINDQFNAYDLQKLADLNGITLQVSAGWHPLIIALVKELYQNGWDKTVSCIKEKYASLRFYTQHGYGDPIHSIIETYEEKSKNICETCGERGEVRSNTSWEYVACRRHYTENRGEVTVEADGFRYNGDFYSWKDIETATFEDLDYFERYRFLKITLKNTFVKHPGWTDNFLYISSSVTGFGNFLNHLPQTLSSLNHAYIEYFKQPEFCEICGYKAVYFDICECCENDSWAGYLKKWKGKEDESEKQLHLKYRQLFWLDDEGERYESQYKRYPKNPDYKLLYTEKELETYLKGES